MDVDKDQERIAALERAVEDLRGQLEALRQDRMPSMRRSYRCFACGHERVLHIRQVTESAPKGATPLSLGATFGMWKGFEEGDPLEVFVCRGCGLVEWYATGFGKLVIDGVNAIELVRDPDRRPGEPYR